MAKNFYCIRFCRGLDEDDLNLVAITTASLENDVDFEIVALACETGDGMADLYHAHFSGPIISSAAVTKAAAQHQLEPSAVLDLCEMVLARADPEPSDATI